MIKVTEHKEPASSARPKLKIFLYLAGFSLMGVVAAYLYEDELYGLYNSHVSFIFALVIPLFFALFFMTCYRVPKLGLTLLGYGVDVPERVEKIHTPTYDIFKSETPTEVKLAATKRKRARHLRKETARNTPPRGSPKPESNQQ